MPHRYSFLWFIASMEISKIVKTPIENTRVWPKKERHQRTTLTFLLAQSLGMGHFKFLNHFRKRIVYSLREMFAKTHSNFPGSKEH